MRNGTKSMMITTVIAAMVATVGVVGGGAANIGAAEQWESEIVGSPDGEPFRVVPEGEIVAIEVGSGPELEYFAFITADGTVWPTHLSGGSSGWPTVRWDLEPGERIVEISGSFDTRLHSMTVFTTHRRIGQFGDRPGGGSELYSLFGPAPSVVVGVQGRYSDPAEQGDPTSHIDALGVITEPIDIPESCQFTVTNASDRDTQAAVIGLTDYTDLGLLPAGATKTFDMPADFFPGGAARWSVSLMLDYVDVDENEDSLAWQSDVEPCGSSVVFDPAVPWGYQPDTTKPSAPAGLDAWVQTVDDGAGGVETFAVLTWQEAWDDREAFEYQVFRNGVEIAVTNSLGWRVDDLPAGGTSWFQVRARDLEGNESVKTAPIRVDAPTGDDERPSVPRNLGGAVDSDGAISLAWDASTDNVGVVDYRVLRNGEEIGVTAISSFVADALAPDTHWIQVVARDAAGNESFKTRPVRFDNEPPTVPRDPVAVLELDRDVTVTWTGSTDNVVGIGFDPSYRVLRNGVVVSSGTSTRFHDPAPAEGSYWYQVVAVDAAGNTSPRTAPVRVDVGPPDKQRPTAPQNLTVAVDPVFNDVTFRWEPSTDNVGVDFYRIFANGQVIGAGGPTGGGVLEMPSGTWWFQVAALDFEGNQSAKTPPVRVDIAAPDTQAPTAPQNLGAVIEANGDVTLTWDAAVDDVGVTEYQVLRNGVEIGVTPTPGFVVSAPAVGSHWYQVVARDAAGNDSVRSAPIRVDVP